MYPSITRVVLRNYTSIASCDVRLGPLTFLVGPNGAGKSNFLRALNLVAVALRTTLGNAIGDVFPFRLPLANGFAVRLDFAFDASRTGHYSFEVAGDLTILREECSLERDGAADDYFRVNEGSPKISSPFGPPPAADDRLYLIAASAFPEFRPVYDLLSGMVFYNPDPDAIRASKDMRAEPLGRKGENLAAVWARLNGQCPEQAALVHDLMHAVLPIQVTTNANLTRPELSFGHAINGAPRLVELPPANVSDGTLRLFALLVALYQVSSKGSRPSLIGIEEPETGIHPYALAVLLDALREASLSSQVIVTSHSAELLDNKDIPAEWILAVSAETGATRIGPVDEVSRSCLRDRLCTAGELLRTNQLGPDPTEGKPAAIFDEQPVG